MYQTNTIRLAGAQRYLVALTPLMIHSHPFSRLLVAAIRIERHPATGANDVCSASNIVCMAKNMSMKPILHELTVNYQLSLTNNIYEFSVSVYQILSAWWKE